MKNSKSLIILILIPILFYSQNKLSYSQENQNENRSQPVPKIALLGMFHFGKTNDLASIKIENVMGEKRQDEIVELISKIEKFNPTKILVEYPYKKTDTLNLKYNDYLNGDFVLTVNEIYQIGFRLAKALGHKELYGIDYRLDLPGDDLVAFCEKTNSMEKFENFVSKVQQYTGNESVRLSGMTLSEYLSEMNSDASDKRANEIYLKDILSFGDEDDEVGANFSSVWYKRNMIMLNNIERTLENNEDRILIIVGSSHRALLKDFISNRSDMEYVEIGEYLK